MVKSGFRETYILLVENKEENAKKDQGNTHPLGGAPKSESYTGRMSKSESEAETLCDF